MSDSPLRELELRATYNSQDCDLARELQIPLLRRALFYDRGVGFFTSGWLRSVAEGLAHFASRGGKARIITSPKLEHTDWEIIAKSSQTEKTVAIKAAVQRTVDELREQLEFRTLDALAWMIRDGLMEFRFAIPRGRLTGGDYHPKVAFFRDACFGWAVHGSMNDSSQAFRNVESVSIFASEGTSSEYYNAHFKTFNQMWAGEEPNIELLCAGDDALEPLLELSQRNPRPYSVCPLNSDSSDFALGLRDYQTEAIVAWEQNGRRGLLEMATGTGKTFTSIQAAVRAFHENSRLALFVVVPYLHLVEQWADALSAVGFAPILCKGSEKSWVGTASETRLLFESSANHKVCFVATHTTASKPAFVKLMSKTPSPKLLIADEAHGLGARIFRNALHETFDWRLGLSATPRRWYDGVGTLALETYFAGTVYEFDLARAILEGHLVPYEYRPILIDLSDEEMTEYIRLSRDLALAVARDDDEKAELIARERARLINGCEGVLPEFLNQLRRQMLDASENGDVVRDTLVYCAPGRHREVLRAVAALGLKAHDFVADTPPGERAALLRRFASGDLQVLVAVKCLDEGVDVPSTRVAYLLASSTNPREFVQRRGRILRTSPGKQRAIVFDFLVGSWSTRNADQLNAARSLARRCLPRFAEFAATSIAPFKAREVLFESLRQLNLLAQMDKRPWDVYRELQNEDPHLNTEEMYHG